MLRGRADPCRLALSVLVVAVVAGPRFVAAVGVDECATNSVCSAKGQTCKDSDMAAAGNWVCACTGTSTGADAPQATATCVFTDECAANFVFCTAQGHTCEDPDAAVTGDWRCVCPSPRRTVTPGSMTVVAVCGLDECLYQGNYQTCHEAGQECKDGNTAITSTGDWTCSCVSGTGMPKVAAPAVCTENGECVVNAAVCRAQGQSCSDPDANTVGDWVCKCVTPETGADSKGGPATCIVDECTATCPTCAKNSCDKTASVCKDANTAASSRGDWRCILDECVANAAKCTGGQTCTDPDDSPTATGDWKCVCPLPQVGSATAGPATCTLDECTMGATKGLCQKFGQLCSDPVKTPASLSDFVCSCVFPLGGTAVAAKATCTGAGSCTAAAVATCEAAGQLCTHTASGFDCVCLPPATGPPGIKAAAVCVLDECAVACSTCADRGDGLGNRCKPASQCKDPDTGGLSVSDWYCAVDECLTKGTVCTNAGQTCKDPDLQKLNTWQCLCKAPASGAQITGTAACTEDECTANKGKCTGQTCTDPDVSKTGDWLCSCVAPLSGRKTGGPATCELDECVANSATCTAAGQTCEDTNKGVAATGDWTCNCIAPATGTPVTAGVATCMQTGECTANEATCTAAKQSCNDPDPSVDGDWQCVCIAPMSGTGMQGVATCELDECVEKGNVCSEKGQRCRDPARTSISLNDWECSCLGAGTGTAVAGPASCTWSGGCASADNWKTCASKGQVCLLATPPSLTDFMCLCNNSTSNATLSALNAFVKDCGAAPGPAGQNCSFATAEACASEGCEWRNHTQTCAVPYCSGVNSCADHPICESAPGMPCARTRCGRRETRGGCETGDGCVWSDSGSAKLPSGGARPYALSPAFCAAEPAPAPEKSNTGFLVVVLCVGGAVCLCLLAAVVYFLRRGKETDYDDRGQGFENTPFMGGAERSMQDSWGSPPPPPPPPPQMQLLPAPILDHEVSLVHVAQPPEPQLPPELTPEPVPPIPDHVVFIEEGEDPGLVCTDEAAGRVWVEDVHPDSPCGQAGVPCGLLTAIDGQPVTRPSDVRALVAVARARAQRLGSSTAEVRLQVDEAQKLPPALAAFSHSSREVGGRLSQRPDAAAAQGQLDTLRRSARDKERILKERALVELDAPSSGLYSPAGSGRGRSLGASFGVSDTSTMSVGRGHPLDQSRHLQSVGGSDTAHYMDADGSHVLHLQL